MHAPLHSVRGPLYPLVFLFKIFRLIIRYTIAVTYKYWQLEEEPLFEENPRKNKNKNRGGVEQLVVRRGSASSEWKVTPSSLLVGKTWQRARDRKTEHTERRRRKER